MIVDQNGNRITSLPLSVSPGTTKPFQLSIACRAGFFLTAAFPAGDDDPNVRFWAKAAPGDSFVNLHTTPLDLAPYDGTTRTFYFECRAGVSAIKGNDIPSLFVAMPT
jgi:hypothetical protein